MQADADEVSRAMGKNDRARGLPLSAYCKCSPPAYDSPSRMAVAELEGCELTGGGNARAPGVDPRDFFPWRKYSSRIESDILYHFQTCLQ